MIKIILLVLASLFLWFNALSMIPLIISDTANNGDRSYFLLKLSVALGYTTYTMHRIKNYEK